MEPRIPLKTRFVSTTKITKLTNISFNRVVIQFQALDAWVNMPGRMEWWKNGSFTMG
jgi:hypothetical protein